MIRTSYTFPVLTGKAVFVLFVLKKAISRESESALPSYALPSLFPPVFEHP
jgi:hypothetical protein